MLLMLNIGMGWAPSAVAETWRRGGKFTPIMQATKPPVLGNAINDDVRRIAQLHLATSHDSPSR